MLGALFWAPMSWSPSAPARVGLPGILPLRLCAACICSNFLHDFPSQTRDRGVHFMPPFLPLGNKSAFLLMCEQHSSEGQAALKYPSSNPPSHLPPHSRTTLREPMTETALLAYSIFSEDLGLLAVQVKRFSKGEANRVLLSSR